MTRPFRRLVALALLPLLTACAGTENLNAPPPPVGDFQLGYVIVVTDKMKQVGPSRDATPEEWKTALEREIRKRTGRYDGDKLYHLGIAVDGYALAYPGIPVLLNPRSILALSVNVWDDTAQRRINAEPKRITVLEPFSGATLVGSGLTQSSDTQLDNLASAAARQIQDWLEENKAWFTPEAVAARAMLPKMDVGAEAQSAVKAAGAAAKPATAPATAAAPAAPAARTAPATRVTPASPARPQTSGSQIKAGTGFDTSVPNSITVVPGATYP